MKAVRYHEKGPADVLKVEELPTPEPGPGEVLIKILATGVSYADVLRRSGAYYPIPVVLPHLPGIRMAGEVVGLGSGVDSSWMGKLVFGSASSGAYAQYGVGPIKDLQILPAGVEPSHAVAILSEAETASMGLTIGGGRMQPGETVFVPAATGGVGYLAIQYAQLFGAKRVFGAASSEAKRAAVAELGAIPIDYTQPEWWKKVIELNEGQGVDLALEVGGGQSVYDTLEVVKNGGRMVVYGNVSDTDAPVNPRALLRRNLTLVGFFVFIAAQVWPKEAAELQRKTAEYMASGQLKALVHSTFPLEQAADAHRALENRQTIGKVMLLPNG